MASRHLSFSTVSGENVPIDMKLRERLEAAEPLIVRYAGEPKSVRIARQDSVYHDTVEKGFETNGWELPFSPYAVVDEAVAAAVAFLDAMQE